MTAEQALAQIATITPAAGFAVFPSEVLIGVESKRIRGVTIYEQGTGLVIHINATGRTKEALKTAIGVMCPLAEFADEITHETKESADATTETNTDDCGEG